jgi:uncharacterized membrane protein
MNKSRLEAFSDGVIAIIITIMVLEIKAPHGSDWVELKPLLPVLYSYFLSFLFVGIYWGNHHHLLHTVKTVNSGIIWANMNLLFWLSLIPIATGWMGENHFATNTVIVYAVLLLLSGIAFTILQFTIQKTNPMGEKLLDAFAGLRTKGIISASCYTLAIPLAFVNTTISGFLFLAVGVLWLVPDRKIEKALKEHD